MTLLVTLINTLDLFYVFLVQRMMFLSWTFIFFQVNEGVREKENSDRLEWIQSHVQCEGLVEVLGLLINSQFIMNLYWTD